MVFFSAKVPKTVLALDFEPFFLCAEASRSTLNHAFLGFLLILEMVLVAVAIDNRIQKVVIGLLFVKFLIFLIKI